MGESDVGEEDELAFSFENEDQMRELKEIKVRLPVSLHLRLHGLKITKGRPISEVVAEALHDYFEKIDQTPSK